jgi:hypothetical protein
MITLENQLDYRLSLVGYTVIPGLLVGESEQIIVLCNQFL